MRVELAGPHGSDLCDVIDTAGAAAQSDETVTGGVLRRENDKGRGPHLRDFSRTPFG